MMQVMKLVTIYSTECLEIQLPQLEKAVVNVSKITKMYLSSVSKRRILIWGTWQEDKNVVHFMAGSYSLIFVHGITYVHGVYDVAQHSNKQNQDQEYYKPA
jgi:hypothetical protein